MCNEPCCDRWWCEPGLIQCWRHTPHLSPAKMTCLLVFGITVSAQRRHLAGCPLFSRDTILCFTVAAEAVCPPATIYAWPGQHLLIATSIDIHVELVRHGSEVGWLNTLTKLMEEGLSKMPTYAPMNTHCPALSVACKGSISHDGTL